MTEPQKAAEWPGIERLAENLRRLAWPSYGKGSTMDSEMVAELRKTLEPLLEVAAKAADQLYDAAYQDEEAHHRQGNRLRGEVAKWRK